MPSVLLATFDLMPDGEPGGEVLVPALAERGIDARWAVWDDDVDWAAADLVVVRSTWDYSRRLPDFLAWAREVDRRSTLLNGADVFTWNADKAYLCDLAALVPTVPAMLLDDRALAEGLAAALERWGSVVIKPRVGAGGVGVVVAETIADPRLEGLVAGPWLAQPLVPSVHTVGETSVYVFGGSAVAQIDKLPSGGEIRIHELYGGSSRAVPVDPARAGVAEDAVRLAAERWSADLAYARVDLMQWEGGWCVSELELIEPGLFLDVAPEIGTSFAELVATRLPV